MKLFYALIILFLFQSCSFDNKTGIWKSENNIPEEKKDLFEEFSTLKSLNKSYNELIPIKKNFKFKLTTPIVNYEWKDVFYNQTNNFKNFRYNEINKIIFKSRTISRNKISSELLLENNNLITSDIKGNINIFSIDNKKKNDIFNFYKKKYKKIDKILNPIVENGIIYISDNIGYLYAYDYNTNRLLWAKNYKIPFRSNLKLSGNKLIASNTNNKLFFFNKNNGEILQSIPTEESIVKNQFINNLSLNNKSLFFLNTYGSLYSIDIASMKINWFLNLNQSLDINPSNLFFGNQIVNNSNKIAVTTNQSTYIIDVISGSILYKKNFSSNIKPIIIDNFLFLVSKNNLLIAMELNSGKIIYSYDINQMISEFFNIKKKKVNFKNIFIVNNKIFIFLKNSYLLKFNIYGNIDSIIKLPSKINTQPIFVDNKMMYLNLKNKLSIID